MTRHWTTALITVAALSALVLGVAFGTFAASDTDPYGYVSEAELIAAGTLRVDQRPLLAMPWRDAELSFIPDGYKRGPEPGVIVPTYPPGLPAVMAAFLRVTGARTAVFYVVPLFGALLVWSTAMLGTRLHSRALGAAAAALMATSPTFLYQVVQPASDVPAAAWWTVSLLFALGHGKRAALLAGAAASAAILTRPNLVPLAAVLGAWYLARAELPRFALFSAGVLPSCLAIAAFNTSLYGGPLESGYAAPLSEFFQWRHVVPNLERYPRWLVETHTPFIFLGLAAPLVVRRDARVWLLTAFVLVIFVSYVLYGYFENWVYTRFLLPAFPPLFLLGLITGDRLLALLTRKVPVRHVVATLAIAALAGWQAMRAHTLGAFVTHLAEQRYVEVGEYIARAMPENAIYIAGLHSGSIRYYSGGLTINFNTLHQQALEDAVHALTTIGRRVFFVVEAGEQPAFRARFDADSDLGRLDWPPAHHTERTVSVSIYDPEDRQRFMTGQPVLTYDMRMGSKPVISQRTISGGEPK